MDSTGMRKRRVGVTARSRQIVGRQGTGSAEVDTEMAAPHELRTPMGTAVEAAIECGWKHGDNGAGVNRQKTIRGKCVEEERVSIAAGETARCARMRRCLILRQGASPLRPPAPFPSESMLQNGGNLSRVRKPRNNGAPLTDSLRSEGETKMRERGPSAAAASCLPLVGTQLRSRAERTARYARMRRCLILRQGANPLRPPPRHFPLTESGLLMEAATVGSGWSRMLQIR